MCRTILLLLGLTIGVAASGGEVVRPPSTPGARQSRSVFDRIFGGAGDIAKSIGGGTLKYFRNRLLDAADIVELNLGLGPGLKAGVEYGLGRTTLGVVEASRIGLDSRQIGMWHEKNAAYGIFPLSFVFLPFELFRGANETTKAIATYGFEIGTIGMERYSRENFATSTVLYEEAVVAGPAHERIGDTCSVGAEAHLGIIGARARVKPLEIFDFAVGFIGLDLDPAFAHPQPQQGPSGKRHPWREIRRK